MDHSEEQILLKSAIAGDAHAFNALLEEYYMMIYSTAFKWVGSKHDAEDIAQEVCVKVGRSIGDFRMESKFSSWLYRIVLNTAKDHVRKRRTHSSLEDISDIVVATGDSAETQAYHKQLWQAVHKLPSKQRDAILLVYSEDLSHAQVAEIMQCKESTVSWYIHEAKKQLKKVMGHHGR
jgi:RNA polymerase sigma-70 factor (ECF subfamily)